VVYFNSLEDPVVLIKYRLLPAAEIMKIYTKTGDRGETGLIGGRRISKADPRIVAYGAVDEINSNIGLAISFLSAKGAILAEIASSLTQVQNDLFVIGSDLADPSFPESSPNVIRATPEMATVLESLIDKFETELNPITYFILPGGSIEASILHQCRSVSRRAETAVVLLAQSRQINPATIMYLNRLSDFLFVCARLANKKQGIADVAWAK
jgi:cob(I)alamin adenosyltransferase